MSEGKSQIYKSGYEKWEGKRQRDLPSWFLIGQNGLRNITASSGCFGRLTFGSFFVIYFFVVVLYSLVHFQWANLVESDIGIFNGIADVLDDAGINAREADYHKWLVLIPSLVFSFFAMFFYGSQLISKDKRANAMQVYFSKAISRTDYVLGKFFAVGMITGVVSLLPSAIVIVLGIFLTTDHTTFFVQSWYVPFLTGGYWFVLTLTMGSITLAFSSLFNKGYMAGIGVVGFMFFCGVFAEIISRLLGVSDILVGFNWIRGIYHLGDVIYSLEITDFGKTFWHFVDLMILNGIALGVIYRNIRPVEVV